MKEKISGIRMEAVRETGDIRETGRTRGTNDYEEPVIDGHRYDAFISYRHQRLDAAVAVRLQELLEGYRPPKSVKNTAAGGIRRIFRDQSELPTSADLGKDISEALKQSRFLIVICSEHLRESVWCMEEIRLFKEMHQGHTGHILTLLVSGEPKDVFPEELLWEERAVNPPVGGTVMRNTRIEPLCADVRAESMRLCLRRLKTEFLRIAAPLLGCGFDELYQRHQRRRRKRRAAIAVSAVTLFSLVLLVVSIFAYRTWVSEKSYKEILSLNYARMGSEYALSANPQEALLYYVEALGTGGDASAASAEGAAILLQKYAWPVAERIEQGSLQDGQVVPGTVLAFDADTGTYMTSGHAGEQIRDKEGNVLFQIEEGYRNLLGVQEGRWTFSEPGRFLIYDSAADRLYTMSWPEAYSKGVEPEQIDLLDSMPYAVALDGGRAMVTYRGMVYLYSLEENEEPSVIAQADLAAVFPEEGAMQGLSAYGSIYLSDDGSMAVVSNRNNTVVYRTDNLTQTGSVRQYKYQLCDVDISGDNAFYAAAYGNTYKGDYSNLGGYFAVYTKNGECVFTLPEKYQKAYLGAAFDDVDSERLLTWGRDFVELWNWRSGTLLIAPIMAGNIRAAAFGGDGEVLVDYGEGEIRSFRLVKPVFSGSFPEEALLASGVGEKQSDMAQGPGGISVLIKNRNVILMDMDKAEVMDFAKVPQLVNKAALSEDETKIWLYSTYTPILLYADVDFNDLTLGEPVEIETHGSIIQYIWSSGDWTAAETEEGALMLFDGKGDYYGEIISGHGGNTDSFHAVSGGCIAVVRNRMEGGTEDYRYYKSGIVEIWDVKAGLLVAEFEYEDDEITAAAVSPEGVLAWKAGGKLFTFQIGVPTPDREALDFLRNLCCCALDESQNIVYKVPSDTGYRMGNWAEYVEHWETEGGGPSAADSDRELSAEEQIIALTAAEEKGSEDWFSQCDALWLQLSSRQMPCDYININSFYSAYELAAVQAGRTECIAVGLHAFITLMCDFVQEDYQVYVYFMNALLSTLADTKEYDEIISRAFCGAARVSLESLEQERLTYDAADEADLEVYGQILHNQQRYFWAEYAMAWGSLLENGKDSLQMESAAKLGGTLIIPPLLSQEAEVYSALLADDIDRAIMKANRYFVEILDWGFKEDGCYKYVSLWIRNLEALAWRNLIDETVLDSFIRGVEFDFGVRVTEISPEAQQAGLRIGDLVIEKDGIRMMSNAQQRRQGITGDTTELTIRREGEVVQVQLPLEVPLYGVWFFQMH